MRWSASAAVAVLGAGLLAVTACSDPDSGDANGANGSSGGGGGGAAGMSGAGAGTSGGAGSTGTGTGAGTGGTGAGTGTGSGGTGTAGSGSSGTAGSGSGTAGSGSGAGGSSSGPACGSRGLRPCGDDELCSFPEQASCGEADRPGTCEPIPKGCTKELAPVCGCDGITYSNRCMALAGGVSVRRSGDCVGGGDAGSGGDPGGAMCGGIAGLSCPDDQYCDFAQGTGCGVADGSGKCAVQPSLCTLDYNPVCGCDGEDYGNACDAASAGVSIDHPGEC